MFLRVYAGEDGQSHFEELEVPSGPGGRSPVQRAREIAFHRLEPGRFVDFHTVPERSYYITLSGEGEIGVGNGEVRRLRSGDMTLCEDLTGQGHSMRVIGGEPRVFVRVTLA